MPLSKAESFAWPDGRRAALSLTFDDARPSQLDRGLPILDAHGVRATFYVSPANVEQRLEDWRRVARRGHEIGNHTLSHPCSGNFPWSRANALEESTLERMEKELTGANRAIEELLGVTPTNFAYPCGETFVGRGEEVVSYVPVVARLFLVGRGAFDTRHNDPTFCDLTQVGSCSADCVRFDELKGLLASATEEGGWLVLFSHEVGEATPYGSRPSPLPAGGCVLSERPDGQAESGVATRQTTLADTLDALCRYARDPANGIWVDTVDAIGRYIQQTRGSSEEGV